MSDETAERDSHAKRSSSDKHRHSNSKSTKRSLNNASTADEKRFKSNQSDVDQQNHKSHSQKEHLSSRKELAKSTKNDKKKTTHGVPTIETKMQSGHDNDTTKSKRSSSKSSSNFADSTKTLSSLKYNGKRKKPTSFYETVNESSISKYHLLEKKLLNSNSDSSADEKSPEKMDLNDELFQDILFQEELLESSIRLNKEATPSENNIVEIDKAISTVAIESSTKMSAVSSPMKPPSPPAHPPSPVKPPSPPSIVVSSIVSIVSSSSYGIDVLAEINPNEPSHLNTVDSGDMAEGSDMDISEVSTHTPRTTDGTSDDAGNHDQEDQLYLLSLAKPVRIVANEGAGSGVIPPPPHSMMPPHFPSTFAPPPPFPQPPNFMPINSYNNNYSYSSTVPMTVGSQPPQQTFQHPATAANTMQPPFVPGGNAIFGAGHPHHHPHSHPHHPPHPHHLQHPSIPTPNPVPLPHQMMMVAPSTEPPPPHPPHINSHNFPIQYNNNGNSHNNHNSNYGMANQPHINYSAMTRPNMPHNDESPFLLKPNNPIPNVISTNAPPVPPQSAATSQYASKLPYANSYYDNGNVNMIPQRGMPMPASNPSPNTASCATFIDNSNNIPVTGATKNARKHHNQHHKQQPTIPKQKDVFELLPKVTQDYINQTYTDSTAKSVVTDAIYRDYHKNWSGISKIWGERSLNSFEIACQVGEGTYGKVYRSKDLFRDEIVALKKIRNNFDHEGFPITAVREIKILRQLCHPNIVKLRDVISDKSDVSDFLSSPGAFYLVFEYMEHDLLGVLESCKVTFSVLQIQSLFKQLMEALNYCHIRNFLHRDLKCSNILLNNKGVLKLADFGLARLYESEGRPYTNKVITLWYRPPELLFGQERYGPYVDIWSAGCILVTLFGSKLCGSPTLKSWPDVIHLPLYQMMKPSVIYPRKLRNHFQFLPADAIDLMDQMLQLDPHKRITSKDILQSNFLIDIDPSKIEPPKFPEAEHFHELLYKKKSKMKNSENHKNEAGSNKSDIKDTLNSQNSNSRFKTGSSDNQRRHN